jgi:hypothetical protein
VTIGALVAAGLCGCAQGPQTTRRSSQRSLLERLVVRPDAIGAEFELRERLVVAHNGYGFVDTGGMIVMERTGPEADAPPAPSETSATGTGDAAHLAPGSGGTSPRPADGPQARRLDLQSQRARQLMAMVRPHGELEGYAEVAYAHRQRAERIEMRYFLTDYPVDYLRRSTVQPLIEKASTASDTASSEAGPGPETEGAGPTSADSGAEGETAAAPDGSMTGTEEFLPAVVEALDKDPDDGDATDEQFGCRVMAHGIRITVRAPADLSDPARRGAEKVAARLNQEIAHNRAAYQAYLQRRDADGDQNEKELSPFWRHMRDHISVEDRTYQPIVIGF